MKKISFKKSGKRAVALALVSCMSLGLALTGCGSKKKKGPVTLTVFSQRANFQGEQTGWSGQIMLDEFNAVLNFVPNDQFDIRVESGDIGDILVLGQAEFEQAANAGLLFDWEEDDILTEYGPIIKENMSDALDKAKTIPTDGKLYGVPNEVSTEKEGALQSFFYTWDIRWDLYEQLGRPEVKDLDGMIDLFKAMKEISPKDDAGKDTVAVSMWPDWDGQMVMYVKSMATSYYGYEGDYGPGHYNPKTGEFYGSLDDNSPYLAMLKFFNKLYREGLVDENSMTQTYDNAIEKVKKNGVFFSIFNYAGRQAYNTDANLEAGRMMGSLTPQDAHPAVYEQNVAGGSCYWAIGSQSADPELSMQIINWLASREGNLTALYGPQGACWDFDEEGKLYFTELGTKCVADKSTPMEGDYSGSYRDGELQINCLAWSTDCPVLNGYANADRSYVETYNKESWASYQPETKYEIGKKWAEYTGCNTVNEYMSKTDYSVIPSSSYVGEKMDKELKTKEKNVNTTVVEGSWNAIYAKSDDEYDKIVADMIKTAQGYGYEEVMNFYRTQCAERFKLEQSR